MRDNIILYMVSWLFLLCPCSSWAQGIGELFKQIMGPSDTTYVKPEKYNSYVHTYSFDTHQNYDFSLSEGKQRLKISPSSSPSLGIGVGYSVIELGYSKSMNSIRGKQQSKNSNFSFNIIGNRWGLQLYKRNVKGDAKIVGSEGFVQGVANDAEDFSWDGSTLKDGKPISLKNESFDGFNSRETGANFYYIFNFKHCSYKAAYKYSTRQVRSAGSVITGLSYSDFKSDLVLTHAPFLDLDEYGHWIDGKQASFTYVPCITQEVNFCYRKLSANIGYSYNWVFAYNFVFNATLCPALSLKWSKVTTYSLDNLQKQQSVHHGDLNFDLIGRSSVQWNNGKWYAGAYGDFTTFHYKKPEVNMSQLFAEWRICMGMYFNLF